MTEDQDTEPTAEELREAEALRATLEGAATDAPADALETVHLLKAAKLGPSIARSEVEAIWQRLQHASPVVNLSDRRRRVAIRMTAAIVAAAAGVLIILRSRDHAPLAPAVPAALVQAQARAAAGGPLEPLEHEMTHYRGHLYAALTEKYGEAR